MTYVVSMMEREKSFIRNFVLFHTKENANEWFIYVNLYAPYTSKKKIISLVGTQTV